MPRTEPTTPEERRAARIDALPEAITEAQLQRVSTGRVRYALSQLAQNNVDKVQGWIEQVALVDGPAKALELYLKLLEYSVPKLTRTEVKVEDSAGNASLVSLDMANLKALITHGIELSQREQRTVNGEAEDVTDLLTPDDDAP